MPEEMPTFGAGYVSLFWGKISMVLKFVNGHVSVVRANMSTKTPKQGQSQAMLTNHGVPDFFPQTALTALVFPCWIPWVCSAWCTCRHVPTLSIPHQDSDFFIMILI